MNIEVIKTELILEVDQLFKKESHTSQQKRFPVKMKSWSEQVADTDELLLRVHCTLQHILQRHRITFKHPMEREGFTHYIEPTIHQLVLSNMKD